ncbi:MAG: glycosyltransferase family 4 protein [Symploca sp. SIO2B6]|nr:glycosyltransferase family 4 protein [Symploca sp. SIO2B6]
MRRLYFLLPGTTSNFGSGGLWAQLNTIKLVQKICLAEIVTYRQRESNHLFLEDILKRTNLEDFIFIVSWGFDVAKLVAKLKSQNVIYHAHSAGYRFQLPPDIPIIAVSRNTMSYWGRKSPNSLIYYLPNQIGDLFYNQGKPRDIDVLVQARKSSEYLLNKLVPVLSQHCQVKVLDSYVEDLAGLFNRAKIYLYDSTEYWVMSGVTEGFGLPPLEALACGCQIFSSVNDALADYLDPGFNCHKIAGYSREYDLQRLLAVLNSPQHPQLPDSFFEEYRTENLVKRLQVILTEINQFFDHRQHQQSNIERLSWWRVSKLFAKRSLTKLQKKLQ